MVKMMHDEAAQLWFSARVPEKEALDIEKRARK